MRLLGLILLVPVVADAQPRGIVSVPRGEVAFARQALPATGVTTAESHVIYLNRGGATLRPGLNDSSRDRSSLVDGPTTIPRWNVDDRTWHDVVDCMRDLFAPFDVTVTDEDPGPVSHIEAVFGGSPADLGLPENVGGVSPFTEDCSVIDRAVVFAFTEVLPASPRTVCEVMAQEVAHSFGLDHELLANDPMTYLRYRGHRAFQDELASCGEHEARPCGINGHVCWPQQSSYALLLERLGPGQSPREPEDPESPGLLPGCSTGGGNGGFLLALCYVVAHRVACRRTRSRRDRPLLQRGSGDRQSRQ